MGRGSYAVATREREPAEVTSRPSAEGNFQNMWLRVTEASGLQAMMQNRWRGVSSLTDGPRGAEGGRHGPQRHGREGQPWPRSRSRHPDLRDVSGAERASAGQQRMDGTRNVPSPLREAARTRPPGERVCGDSGGPSCFGGSAPGRLRGSGAEGPLVRVSSCRNARSRFLPCLGARGPGPGGREGPSCRKGLCPRLDALEA